MKVIVQHLFSKRYWSPQDTWADDPAWARVFDSTTAAVQTCARRGVRDIEIALRFGDPRCDMVYFSQGQKKLCAG